MAMHRRRMPMDVDVRLLRCHVRPMLVLVVLVGDVGVLVRQFLVPMFMLVVLDQVQVKAHAHQRRRGEQPRSQRFAEQAQNGLGGHVAAARWNGTIT